MGPNNMHQIFTKLDKNGDGVVSLEELKCVLDRIGIHASLEELELVVGKTSLDSIDFFFFYDTLIEGHVDKMKLKKKEDDDDNNDVLRETFKIFDTNEDGFISCEELESALSRLGLWDEHCGKDCNSMIHAYDTNLDGKLDFEEFKNMMLLTKF